MLAECADRVLAECADRVLDECTDMAGTAGRMRLKPDTVTTKMRQNIATNNCEAGMTVPDDEMNDW